MGAQIRRVNSSAKFLLPFFLFSFPVFSKTIFYNFFITAEKPSYSLRMSLISGVINIVFDYLFIGVMHYGVAGAAVATAMGEYVGGLVPLIYFARKNNSSRLRLVKPVWRKDILFKNLFKWFFGIYDKCFFFRCKYAL